MSGRTAPTPLTKETVITQANIDASRLVQATLDAAARACQESLNKESALSVLNVNRYPTVMSPGEARTLQTAINDALSRAVEAAAKAASTQAIETALEQVNDVWRRIEPTETKALKGTWEDPPSRYP